MVGEAWRGIVTVCTGRMRQVTADNTVVNRLLSLLGHCLGVGWGVGEGGGVRGRKHRSTYSLA